MQTNIIRKMIKEAIVLEKNARNLSNSLVRVANMRGIQLNSKQLSEVCKFIQEYIEHAPNLLDAISAAAEKEGIIHQVIPILNAVEQYFLAPLDIIPDNLGLLGLVDDAYLAHSLIQALSDSYRNETGRTLLPLDLTETNQFIRNLIGEPQASMLDVAVEGALTGPVIQDSFQSFLATGSMFDMTGPDPIWGNASIDEIVNAQMGALGIV